MRIISNVSQVQYRLDNSTVVITSNTVQTYIVDPPIAVRYYPSYFAYAQADFCPFECCECCDCCTEPADCCFGDL